MFSGSSFDFLLISLFFGATCSSSSSSSSASSSSSFSYSSFSSFRIIPCSFLFRLSVLPFPLLAHTVHFLHQILLPLFSSSSLSSSSFSSSFSPSTSFSSSSLSSCSSYASSSSSSISSSSGEKLTINNIFNQPVIAHTASGQRILFLFKKAFFRMCWTVVATTVRDSHIEFSYMSLFIFGRFFRANQIRRFTKNVKLTTYESVFPYLQIRTV